MNKTFMLKELAYFRSQCRQECEELSKALKARDWRMQSLAEHNLAQAQRQFMYFYDELEKLNRRK